MTPETTRIERFSYVAERVIPSTCLLWVFFLACHHVWSYELFGHVRIGELLIEGGAIPAHDPLTTAEEASPWTDVRWLFQVLAAWVYGLSGLKFVSVAKAASLTLVFLLLWSASGTGVARAWKALFWILPAICLTGRAVEGPELVSWVCLALQLHLLLRATARPGTLWMVPVVQIVWANGHELQLFGPFVVGALLLDPSLRARFGVRRSTTVLLATVVATLANPFGWRGVLFPFERWGAIAREGTFYTERVASLRSYVGYYSGHAIDVYLLADLLLLLVTLASFVAAVSRSRFVPARLLLFLGALALAAARVEYAAVFSIVAGVVFVSNLTDAYGSQLAANLRRDRFNCAVLALYFVLIVAVPTQLWSEFAGRQHRFGFGEDPKAERFPEAAARFAGEAHMPQCAFVAPLPGASVYAYYNAPDRDVFASPRIGLTSRATLERYFELLDRMDIRSPDFQLSAPWEEELRLDDGDYAAVLLERRTQLMQIRGLLVIPTWILAYADRKAAVFVHEETAERLGLDAADTASLFLPIE